MLSCGERCACDLLEHFDFTQPTLSHHMKVLMNAGIVQARKSGTWHNYSLNADNMKVLSGIIQTIIQNTDDCICHTVDNAECSCDTRKNSHSAKNTVSI